MAEGSIKVVKENGFGFIERPGKKDLFFHANDLLGADFRSLSPGQRVTFEEGAGPRGPAARNVRLADHPGQTAQVAPSQPQRPPRQDRTGKTKSDERQTTHPAPASSYRFYNPYNFVRFLPPPASTKPGGQPAAPSGALAEAFSAAGVAAARDRQLDPAWLHLLGRCTPPPHDRYVGLSGRIDCRLTAVTPLFVSDSDQVIKRGEHKTYRFFQSNGRPALPASSLRGMLRSVFEAATNSCLIQMAGETRLTRHLTPQESLGLVPARVVENKERGPGESPWAIEPLPGKTRLTPGSRPSGPQYAAWIGQYIGQTMRRSYSCDQHQCYGWHTNFELTDDLKRAARDGIALWAVLRHGQHPKRRFEFYAVVDLARRREDLRPINFQQGEIVGHGYLHITNQNIENKHDERFFFLPENSQQPAQIPLSTQVVDRYQVLIRDYQSRHAEEVRKRGGSQAAAHPDRGDSNWKKHKPALSNHILDPKADQLEAGRLVYAGLEKSGQCYFVGPVSMPRIACDQVIGRLLRPYLPDGAARGYGPGHLHPCTEPDHLCPACRTFGWVRPKEDRDGHWPPELDGEKAVRDPDAGFAGRVRIGEAELITDKGRLEPTALAILSGPKPTTGAFYLRPNGANDQRREESGDPWQYEGTGGSATAYDEPKNTLRGRKVYRHHPRVERQEYRRAEGRADDQNRTLQDALKPGAEFRFELNFTNLAPLELGALLWCLELEGRGHHRLGYGKPLGFGSVQVRIDTLQLLDPVQRYTTPGTQAGLNDAAEHKAALIDVFKQSMTAVYGQADALDFNKLPNIIDLLLLTTAPEKDLPIHYPRTSETPDPDGKHFEWFMGNKRIGQTLLNPEQDVGLSLQRRDAGR